MGEAKRRRDRGQDRSSGIKISPRKRQAGFLVTHHNRIEEERDGMVYARNVFAVVDPETGDHMVEETPDGPKLVLLLSIPQPVRRAVILSLAR